MENKINVAELLRKCPEGMELDCTIFSKPLKYSGFEGVWVAYPIRTVAENGENIWFTKEGCAHNNMHSECVIFPKGKTTWEGFVPPCNFKGGDVLISQAGDVVLFSHIDPKNVVHYHCILPPGEGLRIEKDTSVGVGKYSDCILANEHQKQRMYDKIKSAGYKYNQDTNKLEKIPEFKNGDICYIKTKDPETHSLLPRFNDGDIIFTHLYTGYSPASKWISIFKRYRNYDVLCHACMCLSDPQSIDFNYDGLDELLCNTSEIEETRFATEEEKQQLFKILKAKGHKWNPETKTLEKLEKPITPKFKVGDKVRDIKGYKKGTIVRIESNSFYVIERKEGFSYVNIIHQDHWELFIDKFDINTLIPFESKVLVRSMINDTWKPAIFGCITEKSSSPFVTVGGVSWVQCIPYKGNEHLLSKTDDCDSYFKTWEE